ncbi:MAG: hypothetical protein Roseis2KO_50880 [Roseivirga sp.]
MSKKHNHIEELTPELIKAYQEGNLTADEMYAVEKYLLENPFEAEALEGLEMVAPDALSTHIDDLNARLAGRLSEKEETKVVFWTMTRKIAASLLVLMTAAFFFFLQEPDVTTKELTQADNTSEQPVNSTTLDSVELINGAARAANQDDKVVKKEEDKKDKDSDFTNQNSGWADSNRLEAKAEPAPSPALNLQTSEDEISEYKLTKAGDLFKTSRADNKVPSPVLDKGIVVKIESVAAVPPVSTEVAALIANDSLKVANDVLNERLKAETDKRAFLGRDAGVKAENQRALLTDLRAQNETNTDSIKAEALMQGFVGNLAKSKTRAFPFTVAGTVVDDEGNPLAGVQVQIKGTSNGMLTDAKGAYNLGSTVVIGSLLFRYLGYATVEEEVKERKEINVEMLPDMSSLGEVVVSDYAPPQPPDEDEVVKNYNPARPIYGQKAFNQHVKENLIYPDAAATEGIKGRVLLEFTVTAEGDLKDIKVLKGLGYGCDEEAIRLVKTGPRWQASRTGIDRGTPVDSKVKVRIRFKP